MPKRKPKLICDLCADEMSVVRTIPAAALLPELVTFRCNGCECFATLEPDEINARIATAKAEQKARRAEAASMRLEAAE
jgi:hypothetical protein